MVCLSACPDILVSLRLIFILLIQFWVFYYLFYSFILLEFCIFGSIVFLYYLYEFILLLFCIFIYLFFTIDAYIEYKDGYVYLQLLDISYIF